MDLMNLTDEDFLLFGLIVLGLLFACLIGSFLMLWFPGGTWLARRKAQGIASKKWYFKGFTETKTGIAIDLDSIVTPRERKRLAIHSPHKNIGDFYVMRHLDIVKFEYHHKQHKWIISYRCCAYLTLKSTEHF